MAFYSIVYYCFNPIIGVCTTVEQPINQVVLDESPSRENDDDGDAFGDDDNDTLLQIER